MLWANAGNPAAKKWQIRKLARRVLLNEELQKKHGQWPAQALSLQAPAAIPFFSQILGAI